MRLRNVLIAASGAFVLVAAAEVALTRALLAPGQGIVTTGAAAIGGPFQLINDSGAPVTQTALAGKPSVIYFGYTYCPEVCPTTLADLSRWIVKLGPDADKLNYVFVTVDPERDTAKVMHEYLQSFDAHIHGFTGSPAQVAQIAKEYKVYYKKVPTQGGYLMDHSSMIYLMDANEKFVGIIPYQEKDETAVEQLKDLVSHET
jgi:protein SCO1